MFGGLEGESLDGRKSAFLKRARACRNARFKNGHVRVEKMSEASLSIGRQHVGAFKNARVEKMPLNIIVYSGMRHSLRIYPYPMLCPFPRPWSETMGFLGLERPFLDLVSQTPRPRGRGRPFFAEHSYTVECGNRLRDGVHAKNASVSGFACRSRSGNLSLEKLRRSWGGTSAERNRAEKV